MNKRKKTLYVQVDGGLANRFHNIINGFYYYEKYSFNELCIIWPPNRQCGASYGELFAKPGRGVTIAYKLGVPSKRALPIGFCPCLQSSRKLRKKYKRRLSSGRDCRLAAVAFIHPDIPTKKVRKIINTQMPRPSAPLLRKINRFLVKNNLQRKKYIGVHIRRTDIGKKRPDSFYISRIRKYLRKNKNQKFFLCSDDSKVEKKIYSKFPSSIVIRPKKHQPNAQGRYIRRAARTTQNGLIDLFLLSQASQIIGSHGTYSRLAGMMVKACMTTKKRKL